MPAFDHRDHQAHLPSSDPWDRQARLAALGKMFGLPDIKTTPEQFAAAKKRRDAAPADAPARHTLHDISWTGETHDRYQHQPTERVDEQ